MCLPHELLTASQIRKLNGKVSIYRMKSPIKWSDFLKMPADLANQYISELSSKYNVNYRALGEMFDVSPSSMRSAFKTRNIQFTPPHGMMSKEDAAAWQRFLKDGDATSEAGSIPIDSTYTTIPKIADAQSQVVSDSLLPHMRMSQFSLNFNGPLDSRDLAQTLVFMIGEGTDCNIRIDVAK